MEPKRPQGVVAVAVISLLWGMALLLIRFGMPGNLGLLVEGGRILGYPPFIMVSSAVIIPGLWIASAVGLVTGRRWGWWLGGFHFISGCLRCSQAVLFSAGWHPAATWIDPAEQRLATPHAFGLVVYVGLLLFLYSGAVRQWCSVATIPRGRALVLTSIAVLVVMGGASAVSYAWVRWTD